jgi:hypothetical protein
MLGLGELSNDVRMSGPSASTNGRRASSVANRSASASRSAGELPQVDDGQRSVKTGATRPVPR